MLPKILESDDQLAVASQNKEEAVTMIDGAEGGEMEWAARARGAGHALSMIQSAPMNRLPSGRGNVSKRSRKPVTVSLTTFEQNLLAESSLRISKEKEEEREDLIQHCDS